MARILPVFFDEIAMIAVILLFLLINYNMPLASIYTSITFLLLFLYLVPIIFNLFKWINLSDKQNRTMEIIGGIGAAIAFIWFYNTYLSLASPLAIVFATTAFGESVALGKFVFGFLIPTIETIFFFVVLPTWALWKIGTSFTNEKLFTIGNLVMIGVMGAIFTIFHATSKGLTNNQDLMATFLFAALSIGLILYFKTALPAIILHIAVNSSSIGIFDAIKNGAILSSPYLIGGIIVIGYFLLKSPKLRIFGT